MGHMDPGETIDFESGTLKIMTLRKDPMHRPKIRVIIISNGSTILKAAFFFYRSVPQNQNRTFLYALAKKSKIDIVKEKLCLIY